MRNRQTTVKEALGEIVEELNKTQEFHPAAIYLEQEMLKMEDIVVPKPYPFILGSPPRGFTSAKK